MADLRTSDEDPVSDVSLLDLVRVALAGGGNAKVTIAQIADAILPLVPAGTGSSGGMRGRLTLESGVPISTSDQTAKSTVYWTPYLGKNTELWDGSEWTNTESAEISMSVGTGGAFAPRDVFMYLNAGVPTLEGLDWRFDTATVTIASPGVWSITAHGKANGDPVVFTTTGALPTGLTGNIVYWVVNQAANTFQVALTPGGAAINTSGTQSGVHTAWSLRQRATGISLQDGRMCKTGDKTRRYLGTLSRSTITQTEDSLANRYLWNYHNRVNRKLYMGRTGGASSHSYNGSYRAWNNDITTSVRMCVGVQDDATLLSVVGETGQTAAIYGITGMALNSFTVPDSYAYALGSTGCSGSGSYSYFPVPGWHTAQALESTVSGGSATFINVFMVGAMRS